ncbi:MAG: hypothetical protein JXR81_10235 [Candidatus Goldbacteria bacterium]|nr:hypothetical protein [Candidatus Goldiibacteriota bacterium]
MNSQEERTLISSLVVIFIMALCINPVIGILFGIGFLLVYYAIMRTKEKIDKTNAVKKEKDFYMDAAAEINDEINEEELGIINDAYILLEEKERTLLSMLKNKAKESK